MTVQLRLKFDPNQDYQIDAIDGVVRLFDGLAPQENGGIGWGEDIVTNLPPYQNLSESWLYDNLLAVQETFNQNSHDSSHIDPLAVGLEVDDGLVLEGVGDESWRYPSFTVEMETGTGKTYVYLRTIYELSQRYGFRKFIIVVPSRAIYEGVIKTFDITRSHFASLYNNMTVNVVRYDGSQISRVRTFATLPFTDIMVMTLDSFNRKTNNLFKSTEKLPGEWQPYQYIQATRPILILDEPQNMESDRAREALRTLHPLFALRYSATHRTAPNLIYRLTPFEAYRRNLVKKIQVYGVTERDDLNRPFLSLKKVERSGGKIAATVSTYRSEKGTTRQADVVLKQGDDLAAKTKRDEHQGYVVHNIHLDEKWVEFENGLTLRHKETIGADRVAIFREQIKQTIIQHMEQQQRLYPRKIKVLSLFFIDRVANYINDDGLIKQLFDELFDELKGRYPFFRKLEAANVREGYFAKRKVKGGEEVEVDTVIEDENKRKSDIEAERAAYQLIMRDKERLLSFTEPVCFIFAHSALKEGWDNPNVFQICTLNQTVSPIKKRQEIGRGLRLPVDQSGERIFDDDVNVLTVVANESYRTYAATLQSEYVAEGLAAPPPPTSAHKKPATRNNKIFQSDEFNAFWQKLMRQVHYQIHIDTPTVIEECVGRINREPIPETVLVVEKGQFVVTEYTFRLESANAGKAKIHIKIANTNDETSQFSRTFKVRDDLAKILNDQRLRGFKIVDIAGSGGSAKVIFNNDIELTSLSPITYQSEAGQQVRETQLQHAVTTHPVLNLLDRTAKETGLTRPTINAIFKGLASRKKARIFTNPEGFANVFITEVRNGLADHIAENIEFVVGKGTAGYNLEELFPHTKEFPQKELIVAGLNGLYDQVQHDSQEEVDFVTMRLRDQNEVVFYFKFPPLFKIYLPTLIGNYNPDWGVVRLDGDNQPVLELVRETKGTIKLEDLQFPQEKRKIICAQKYFKALDIDYRHVKAQLNYWYLPEQDPVAQRELGL